MTDVVLPDLPETTAAGETPRIYRGRQPAYDVGWLARLIAFGVAAGCLAVLIAAAYLQPSHTGVGSHRGLGLQSCQWLDRTGVPCPACGMTTSFSWFVRGDLIASAYVQPMGALIALAACCCVSGGLYVAVTGKPVYRLLTLLPARPYLIGLLGFGLAAWGWKVFIHARGLDGWG